MGDGAFPRERSLREARAIFEALPRGTVRVALSLSADADVVARVVEEAQPDVLHVGAATELVRPDAVAAWKARFPGVAWMRSIPIVGEEVVVEAARWEGVADWLLLDSHLPGDRQIGARGVPHDWRISRRIVEATTIPVILAGGLGPGNVADAVRIVRPAGVDSKTKTDRVGGAGKDLAAVARFVAAARAAASTLGG